MGDSLAEAMETCETQEEPALHLSVQGTFLERTRKMSGNRKCQVRTLRTSPRRPGDELKGTLKQEPQSLWKTSEDVSCLAVRLNTLPGQTVAQDSESHEFHHQRMDGFLSMTFLVTMCVIYVDATIRLGRPDVRRAWQFATRLHHFQYSFPVHTVIE